MLSETVSDEELLPSGSSKNIKSKKKDQNQTSNEILKAYQVNVFKFIDGKYENRGKLGLAVLGTKSTYNFNLLLYSKGSTPVTQAAINCEFIITSTKELYFTFYDIKSENWSIIFDSIELFRDFSFRICILKMFSSKTDYEYVDINVGEGNTCQDGDLCEVEIDIYAIHDFEPGSLIYSSKDNEMKIIRTKVGSNKLIPIAERCLLGMSKGGCRVISVLSKSPLCKSCTFVKLPPHLDIIIYLKIMRLKVKMDKPSITTDTGESDLSLPNISLDKVVENKKADLIQRMAKMGQAIVSSSVSDNSTFSEGTPILRNVLNSPEQNTYTYSNHPNYNSQIVNSGQILPYQFLQSTFPNSNQTIPTIQSSHVSSNNDLNLLFTETRQSNSEIRISLSKLQDKIDNLMDKINTNTNNSQSLSRYLDADTIYENIKRIIKENDELKKECYQKNETIDLLNKRINEIMKKNQGYLEDSHNIFERNSVSFKSDVSEHQNKILALEEEKLNLIRNLSQKTSELSNLEMKLEYTLSDAQNYKAKSLAYCDQLTSLSDELSDFKFKNRTQLTELNELKESLKSQNLSKLNADQLKVEFSKNEENYKQKLGELRNTLSLNNEKIDSIKYEYETEINEIREHHSKEINELKQKSKNERQRLTNKHHDYDTEIDGINKTWEEKLDKFRRSESVKYNNISEKNSQLMIENTNLNSEITELKENLAIANNKSSTEFDLLSSQNKKLQDEINHLRDLCKISNKSDVKINLLNIEIDRLTSENKELKKINTDYNSLMIENETCKKQIEELNASSNSKSIANNSNQGYLEVTLKNIMNGIFKEIKSSFASDESYFGKEILKKCMVIIRDSTMFILQHSKKDGEEDEEDEENEEDEEDDEDDKEEDDEDDEEEDEEENNNEQDQKGSKKDNGNKNTNDKVECYNDNKINIKDSEFLNYDNCHLLSQSFNSSKEKTISDCDIIECNISKDSQQIENSGDDESLKIEKSHIKHELFEVTNSKNVGEILNKHSMNEEKDENKLLESNINPETCDIISDNSEGKNYMNNIISSMEIMEDTKEELFVKVESELEEVHDENDSLNPSVVVEPTHPLHIDEAHDKYGSLNPSVIVESTHPLHIDEAHDKNDSLNPSVVVEPTHSLNIDEFNDDEEMDDFFNQLNNKQKKPLDSKAAESNKKETDNINKLPNDTIDDELSWLHS